MNKGRLRCESPFCKLIGTWTEWTYFICFVNIKLNNNFMLCVMIGEVLWLEFYIYFYC